MCLFIFEILLFGCGLYALVTGRLPAMVFGGKYRTEGTPARVIGFLLILPIPTAFTTGFLAALLIGDPETGKLVAQGVEMVLLLTVLSSSLIINRRVRVPVAE